MVDKYNNIKIIDFASGGCKKINSEYICHQQGTYDSPEMDFDIYMNLYDKYVIKDKTKLYNDFFPPFFNKNDIFALGFVFWELFNFPKAPFEDKYKLDDKYRFDNIYEDIKNNEYDDIKNNVPKKFKTIINGCWEYDMFKRITIDEIIKILENEKK
jgi:hypothetical protein